MHFKYGGRHALADVGTLPQPQRAFIQEWLEDNFCGEDTFECELSVLPDGGLHLDDPTESVGHDDAFGVYLITDDGGAPAFLVVLFEEMPQGCVVDVKTNEPVAGIIEGSLCDVVDG